jgi:hypothetical protein
VIPRKQSVMTTTLLSLHEGPLRYSKRVSFWFLTAIFIFRPPLVGKACAWTFGAVDWRGRGTWGIPQNPGDHLFRAQLRLTHFLEDLLTTLFYRCTQLKNLRRRSCFVALLLGLCEITVTLFESLFTTSPCLPILPSTIPSCCPLHLTLLLELRHGHG